MQGPLHWYQMKGIRSIYNNNVFFLIPATCLSTCLSLDLASCSNAFKLGLGTRSVLGMGRGLGMERWLDMRKKLEIGRGLVWKLDRGLRMN